MGTLLDDLVGRIEDPELQSLIADQISKLQDDKAYGLVFPEHLPETVRLPNHPVRRGTVVALRTGTSDETWAVRRVSKSGSVTLVDAAGEISENDISNLVVVRKFGDPVFPGLERVGVVERSADKPFHSLINAENYHALETLLYSCEGKVDVIYIDPPYNSGAKDWKYNNDYVDANDIFRHSKWLSFMERRLTLAKRLLSSDGVLIVTIDEKEVHPLGMLLERMFPDAVRQMVTSVINPMGSRRAGEFSRVDEYVFFVLCGEASIPDSPMNMLDRVKPDQSQGAVPVRWTPMNRDGSGWERSARPKLFYPLFVNRESLKIEGVGVPIPLGQDRQSVPGRLGCATVWPMKGTSEARWQVGPDTCRELITNGFVTVSSLDSERPTATVRYLTSGAQKKVETGTFRVTGRRDDGSKIVETVGATLDRPRSVWNQPSHSARDHGSTLLRSLIPGRKFPYPKSLYAVEDTLRFVLKDRPDALVLDFFGGSGSTAHAVMRLNHQDGGRRRSIIVTNNEVSVEEAAILTAQGLTPGVPEWEKFGIAEYITWPRIVAAVTGRTHSGKDITGDYKFTDEFPMAEGFEENVEFFNLTYLDRNEVERGRAFEAIAPLLWMEAGSVGKRIAAASDSYAISESGHYAVLFDVGAWSKLSHELDSLPDVTLLFVVTDSLAQYQQIVSELSPEIRTRMLYEDYLINFELNTGGIK